jgi:hypothetical protein
MNLKFFWILSVYTIWDGLSLKTISRYCPFKQKLKVGSFALEEDALQQRLLSSNFSSSCRYCPGIGTGYTVHSKPL